MIFYLRIHTHTSEQILLVHLSSNKLAKSKHETFTKWIYKSALQSLTRKKRDRTIAWLVLKVIYTHKEKKVYMFTSIWLHDYFTFILPRTNKFTLIHQYTPKQTQQLKLVLIFQFSSAEYTQTKTQILSHTKTTTTTMNEEIKQKKQKYTQNTQLIKW